MGGMAITMLMEADKINAEKPDKSLFEIPADYKQAKLDPSKLGF